MRTYLQAKAMAKSLRESLATKNVSLSHAECLELVAHQLGFGNWNILAAKIDIDSRAQQPRNEAGNVRVFQLLPVLRVASRQAARDFYVDVMGFRFDWGDEEADEFYAQVSRGELQMHLTSACPARSAGQVYFRMTGLDAFQRELTAGLGTSNAPAIRHTNYDARELAIEDPFGNLLRFVEGNAPGIGA